MEETKLSRDAEVVAYCLFPMGSVSSLTFNRPHIIHPRTRAALDELTKAGLIEAMDPKKLPRGAMGWKATEPMGDSWKRFSAPTSAESFPITTE